MQSIKNNTQGFTLIELMVVLAVFGIMTMIAVPFFTEIISSKDMNTARNTVIHTLNKAKRIASAENTFVNVELENNSIQMETLGSGKKENHPIPRSVTFSEKLSLTFDANGIVVNEAGNSIESNLEILIKNKSNESVNETISISTTGLVAAM